MYNLNFVPKIICELGASGEIASALKELGCVRPLIVTDRQLLATGLLNKALKNLDSAEIAWRIFSEVTPNPSSDIVNQGVATALDANADVVIGFGGGSSLDCAKLIALLARSSQNLDELCAGLVAHGDRFPLIQIPTTAGTGSEVTSVSVVTTQDGFKRGITSPKLAADIAILDAELTMGLSIQITAMVGIDAIIHAVEAYTSKVKKNPISDALAISALKLLMSSLPLVVSEPASLAGRSDMLLGACMAGLAFANAPVGAIHALGYPIGSNFKVPHGLSNALVMREVLHFNSSGASAMYAELAKAVLDYEGDQKTQAQYFINSLCTLSAKLPYAQCLSDVGISQADLPQLAIEAMTINRLLVNNPRPLAVEDALAIYQASLLNIAIPSKETLEYAV